MTDITDPLHALPILSKTNHAAHCRRCLMGLPSTSTDLDATRLVIAFYCIGSLDLLGLLHDKTTEADRETWKAWLWDQYTSGRHGSGFRSSPYVKIREPSEYTLTYDTPHLIMTYAGILTLAILRDDFRRLERPSLVKLLRTCQREDGSFSTTPGDGETDMRSLYCAFAISMMLDDWSGINIPSAVKFIASCRTHEGGYGQSPFCEAHGGTTYLAIASLHLIPEEPRKSAGGLMTPFERTQTIRWLVQNQEPSGGFRGRTTKPADACYCFWCGASLEILGVKDLVDASALLRFIANCQYRFGGISKAPGDNADPYHTFLSLATVSMYTPRSDARYEGWRLQRLDPLLNVREETSWWIKGCPSVHATSTRPSGPSLRRRCFRQQRVKFPVCCLKPRLPNSAVEDQVLLSFQEWKEKQRNSGELKEQHVHGEDVREVAFSPNASKDNSLAHAQNDSSQTSPFQAEDPIPQSHQRYFRIPLTDRFNYASLDCSARVHAAHRSAKSPSAVLNSKRDRYMLSPCKAASGENQFIVVELCEDIRIDTVQLANFEFFSGVFKDFSVHVAKTDATNDKSWEDAGTFRAKNNRGIQSFHPPPSLRDFYRYIRIDFHSHYGNEYYCPVSLLRVYGLTHLEEYKWEQWEEQSKAKLDADARSSASGKGLDQLVDTPSITAVVEENVSSFPTPAAISFPGIDDDHPGSESVPSADTQTLLTDGHDWFIKNSQSETQLHDSLDIHLESQIPSVTTADASLFRNNVNSETFADTLPSDSTVYAPTSTSSGQSGSASSNQHLAQISSAPPASSSFHGGSHSNVMATNSTLTSPVISPTVAPSTSGESIYRVIMNRLTALEANHTLYARYIEQQNIAVRDLLKRLNEDVGRLEGIGRAHGQKHQRAVQEWERQRQQLQMEFRELLAVVEYLSDEITLEKRLGIAQLCLLLLVLVFMALTRGSRGEPLIQNEMTTSERPSKLKDLSGRLNLSIDRTKHLNSISSTEGDISNLSNQRLPHSSRMRADSGSGPGDEFMFPQPKMPLTSIDINLPPSSSANRLVDQDTDVRPRKISDSSRSRTPSFRRSIKRNVPHHLHLGPHTNFQYHGHQRTLTPSKSTIRQSMIGRSSSHPYEAYGYNALWSGVGSPRSARKSAKSAHLHEVVRTAPLRRNKDGGGDQMPRSSAADVHLMRTRHRHTSSDVPPVLVYDTDDRKHLFSGSNEVTGSAKDADDGNPESDQSAWEDADSITGE
ncbi:hypothetical protein APHAL10511_002642 [Amanita phalloides]|nr:hypothetical protein APHAL10511_002642 [Amanita phalloides]